jgi:hypothetical protein
MPTPSDFNISSEWGHLAVLTPLRPPHSYSPATCDIYMCVPCLPCTGIVEGRTKCQLSCTNAPASNRLANPPYKIHNFGWKGDAPNNGVRDRARYGDETAPLDLKSISVTAREFCEGCLAVPFEPGSH